MLIASGAPDKGTPEARLGSLIPVN
jgi:hypothetical protein